MIHNMTRVPAVILLLGICFCLPLHAGSLTVQVFNQKHQPLADAVIYLTSDETPAMPVNNHFEIEQKDKIFKPFVTVLPIGAKTMFPNRDGIGHHVYSFSPVKKFQLPLSEYESTDTVTFDQAGVVTVGCNIHDWMVAYIYVVDTPYYAKSVKDGAAMIDNVPDGDYEIHVAHPGMKSVTAMTKRIDMAVDTKASLEFSLDIKPEYYWRPSPRTEEEIY